MIAEVDCLDTSRDRSQRFLRHQNLSTPTGFGEPATVVHRRAEEVPVPFLGRAVVNARPNPQMRPQVAICQRDLDVDRCPDGVVGTREDRGETVTGGGENPPTDGCDRPLDNPIVGSDGLAHANGIGIPQPCRSLDVCDEKREHVQTRRAPELGTDTRFEWLGSNG